MHDLKQFLDEFDILRLIEKDTRLELVVSHGANGPEYKGPCPLCKGEDRFMVWPQHRSGRGRFWCRDGDGKGCGIGGDALSYVAAREKLNLRDQADLLRAVALLGGELTPLPGPAREKAPVQPVDVELPGETWVKRATTFAAYAHELLYSEAARPVLNYLYGCRGLYDSTLQHFRVGVNPTDLYDGIDRWGLESGKKIYLSMGIVIPGHLDGQVQYVQIRRPCRHKDGTLDVLAAKVFRRVPRWRPEVKYMNVKGGARVFLFGVDELTYQRPLLICEGEFDAMLCWQHVRDLVDVVAIGGAAKGRNGLPVRWMLRLAPYERILVAYDTDKAGQVGARALLEQSARAEAVVVPQGNDVTDFYLAGGNLRDWIGGLL